jgi:hypothetical protein
LIDVDFIRDIIFKNLEKLKIVIKFNFFGWKFG